MQLPPTDHILNDEESYAKLTLGTTQTVPTGEIKILGIRWNPSTTDSYLTKEMWYHGCSIWNTLRGML